MDIDEIVLQSWMPSSRCQLLMVETVMGGGGHGAQTHAVPGAHGSHVLCGVHSACGLCIFLHDLNSVAGMAEL